MIFFSSCRFLHRHMQHRDWMLVVANSSCLSLFGAESALFWDFWFLVHKISARPVRVGSVSLADAFSAYLECPLATNPPRFSLVACHYCFSSRIPSACAAILMLFNSCFFLIVIEGVDHDETGSFSDWVWDDGCSRITKPVHETS